MNHQIITPMRRIIYRSHATVPFDATALERLAIDSSLNNLALGVTGVLLFRDGCFVQLLEGPVHAVGTLADRIAADPRHDRYTTLLDEVATTRWVDGWTMALGAGLDDLPPQMAPYVGDLADGGEGCR